MQVIDMYCLFSIDYLFDAHIGIKRNIYFESDADDVWSMGLKSAWIHDLPMTDAKFHAAVSPR